MHPWITAVKWTLKSYLNMSQGKDYRSVVQDKLYFECNIIVLSTNNLIYKFISNKAKCYKAN